MATLTKSESRRMYSWWWNSHISPKNSKWLQENLSDMDNKVKSMIKLIEEDADSFARRAEMFYEKRPELMKLVEEFYRAYRALAERYDHATGALRQAHRTMAEAFPSQVPSLTDDSPAAASSASCSDPRTPCAFLDLDNLQKDALELPSSHFDSGGSKGTVKRGLKFNESDEGQLFSESEIEIMTDNDILAKLENEKEAGLKQYQESLERLSKLESEIFHAQQDCGELTDRASKAEAEVQNLKDALQRLEAEKLESLELYHQCLKKTSELESVLSHAQQHIEELSEQTKNGENAAEILRQDISRLESEKNAAHDQYKQSLQMISDLKKKLKEVEEEASKFSERAEKAECEVETLKKTIVKLIEEKEVQRLLYEQCLEDISSLELGLSCAQQDAERLKSEINNGVVKLKCVEEERLVLERSNQTLHSELESTVLKLGAQTRELTEKQKELGRLWTCIQEERLRFVETETAFQTLQRLHSQDQEEVRSLAQMLTDMETRNQGLQAEIEKHKVENKNLNELNSSSVVSLKGMQTEIASLKETKGKLQEEVDQRNALEQEMHRLKEELNELNKNHRAVLEQVADVGCDPECFQQSVKELQYDYSNLKAQHKSQQSEKVALLEKLEIMGQLLETNAVLKNSLSDLGIELDRQRTKIKALEESYQRLLEEKSSLAGEKANLLGQLQVTTENLTKLSEKNTLLENSLFDAHVKLEVLKEKSERFEDSCQFLADERFVLVNEQGTLVSQIESTEKSLKDLELRYTDLQEKYIAMEKERESALCKAEVLSVSLAVQNQEHVTFAQVNEKRLDNMRSQIELLKEEFDKELDKALGSEIEIFVLLRCIQDLEEKNLSLFNECQKLQEASKLQLLAILENEKMELEEKVRELTEVCVSLQEQTTWKDLNIESLKERSRILECENEELKTHLDAYGPALASLRDCISLLENHTCVGKNVHTPSNKEAKDAELVNCLGEDQKSMSPDALSDLYDVQSKVGAIEAAVVATVQEKLDSDSKLEAATRQIEDLRNQRRPCKMSNKSTSISEISEEEDPELVPKDIMLDEHSFVGEIWEAADQGSSIDEIETVSMGFRRPPPHDEPNKRKVLERLNSDVQKLSNLQITIDDLKSKVEITVKSRRGKPMVECETLKGQLVEAETAIQKLFQLNAKLVKHLQDIDSDKSSTPRKKRVSDQAKRVSEKIGRLQLEVQKIQFFLLKLDNDDKGTRTSTSFDTKSRHLLKDYLYGGGGGRVGVRAKSKIMSKRKKPHFCACVHPPTKGD